MKKMKSLSSKSWNSEQESEENFCETTPSPEVIRLLPQEPSDIASTTFAACEAQILNSISRKKRKHNDTLPLNFDEEKDEEGAMKLTGKMETLKAI